MALVEKISVKPSEALMAKLPKGRGASVEITFASGQPARETVDITEGDAQRPLPQASLERKFMNFAVPVVSSSAAERIVSLVENLDHVADVRTQPPARKAPPSGKECSAPAPTGRQLWMTHMGAKRTAETGCHAEFGEAFHSRDTHVKKGSSANLRLPYRFR
jgi:MmgE/PrpD C-terminal domain